MLHIDGDTLIVALYVDDLVITGSNIDFILGLNKQFTDTVEMTDLGLLHFFLGIQVLQMDDGIFFISQPKYVLDLLLQKFNTGDCKPCATPYRSGVKLTKECDSQKVSIHPIDSLLVASFISHTVGLRIRGKSTIRP